jgi:hypothetical protein
MATLLESSPRSGRDRDGLSGLLYHYSGRFQKFLLTDEPGSGLASAQSRRGALVGAGIPSAIARVSPAVLR